MNERSKYPPRHCLLIRPALFYFLVDFLIEKKNVFLLFFNDFFCTHVSDFLAYGYRSEGCASWASPLTPFIFFWSSVQVLNVCVILHLFPVTGVWTYKVNTCNFLKLFFQKKKYSLSLKWEIKISSKTLFINKTSSFILPGWNFNQRKLFFAVF